MTNRLLFLPLELLFLNCNVVFQKSCYFFLSRLIAQPHTSCWCTETIHKVNKCLRNTFSPKWGDRVLPELWDWSEKKKKLLSKKEIFLSCKHYWDFLKLAFLFGDKTASFPNLSWKMKESKQVIPSQRSGGWYVHPRDGRSKSESLLCRSFTCHLLLPFQGGSVSAPGAALLSLLPGTGAWTWLSLPGESPSCQIPL